VTRSSASRSSSGDRPAVPTPAAETGPRIAVLGTGYLGATHAVCMAALGFTVVGYDVDATKVERLAAGEVPIFEPNLEELLRKLLSGLELPE